MAYQYLSYFLDASTPLYGGGRGISIEPDRQIKNGDTANTCRVIMGNHSGTHIDFPHHFFEEGKKSNDYQASEWIFSCPFLLHLDVEENDLIFLSDEQIAVVPVSVDFLIMKTGFGLFRKEDKYSNDNPGLHPDLAGKLRAAFPQLRAIGVDLISITSFQNRPTGRIAHRKFLGEPSLLLVEDMYLEGLTVSPKKIFCFPLLLKAVDGSPVTVIAEME